MAGSGVYARHGFVRWSAIVSTISVFFVSTLLYSLPLAVLLALLACCAYCGVTYLSFTLEGRDGRARLERAYDNLFSTIYGANSPRTTRRQQPGRGAEGRESRPKQPQPSLSCHKEAQKIIRLIMRDFVLEWYKNVTTEDEFPEDCRKILEHVALEINTRVQQIDLDQAVQELLAAILPYLEAVNQAGKVEYNGVEIFDVTHERCLRCFEENPSVAHRALRSPESETRYYRQLLDSLLQSALPEVYRNCNVTCLLLREILLRNILGPVLTLVCDPDFLNKAIPIILKKADPEDVKTVLNHIEEENRELECAQMKGRLIQAHRRPTQRFHSIPEHFPVSTKPIPVPLSQIYSDQFVGGAKAEEGEEEMGEVEEVDTGHDGMEGERGESGESGEGGEKGKEREREDSIELPTGEEEGVDRETIFSPSPTSSLGSSDDTPTLQRRGSFLGLSSMVRRSLSRRQTLPGSSPRQRLQTPPTLPRPLSSLGVASSSSVESDPDLVCVELPPVFATRYIHVRHSNSTYIGYVFKFPKTMLLPGDLQEVGVASEETHLESVKRYSDFTRLHQQLQKTPELLKHTQGLDLPERHGFANVVSKLPFTSRDLDPTALLERKQGLEKYIQLMSSKQEILRSRIFQDFLKSGILLLRQINSLHLYKSRHKRTLLGGIMKGQSDETDEAQPLPKRPMESVLSAFLNTTLPLPCRQMNTLNQKNKASLTSQTGSLTGQTGSPAVGHRERRERFVKAATIGEVTSSDHKEGEGGGGGGKRRTSSLTDSERVLGRKAGGRVDENNESCETQTETGKCDSDCYGNGVNMDAVSTTTSYPDAPESLLTRTRSYLIRFCSSSALVSRTAIAIVYRCSLPFTQHTLTSLSLNQQQTHPLSNTLLSLGTEASRRHCPELWVTDKSTQTGVLTLVGGAIDRFLSGELGSVVKKEQNWMRMLYRLRHNLWVEGCKELDRSPREKLTAGEREERKKAAIAAFRKFLPNFLPYVVGSEDYDHAVTHCLECLQNPHINRHFFLRVIDILLPKLIPELHSDEFQKRLARLRTLTPTNQQSHHKTSRSHSSYPKKH